MGGDDEDFPDRLETLRKPGRPQRHVLRHDRRGKLLGPCSWESGGPTPLPFGGSWKSALGNMRFRLPSLYSRNEPLPVTGSQVYGKVQLAAIPKFCILRFCPNGEGISGPEVSAKLASRVESSHEQLSRVSLTRLGLRPDSRCCICGSRPPPRLYKSLPTTRFFLSHSHDFCHTLIMPTLTAATTVPAMPFPGALKKSQTWNHFHGGGWYGAADSVPDSL